MLPVIAIIGRPNVGKSTLFNRLTRSKQALVVDQPGVTRDRIYGEAQINDRNFIVIDTGGLLGEKEGIENLMEQQSWQAVEEADAILFVVDARAGIMGDDDSIIKQLRRIKKPVFVVVNKVDGRDPQVACADFFALGMGNPIPIAASHGEGISTLIETVFKALPASEAEQTQLKEDQIKVAIIGRPNVGKSTLINRILGEKRVIVFDAPGTTRDSIYIPFQREDKKYVLIDTAGVRRRRGIKETVEKFSVIKTLQAIEDANVVISVFDAQEGITDQDLHLIGFAIDAGKALIIAINKWDGLPVDQREYVKKELDRRLDFVAFARKHFISALHGTGVGELYASIDEAYESATRELTTSELTRVLETAVESHHPPAPQGRLIKLRYAHAGGHNPPTIVIHGKQTDSLPNSYVRYLENYFRKTLKLVGTPIKIVLKSDENPYQN